MKSTEEIAKELRRLRKGGGRASVMASDVDQAVEAASLLKQSDDAQWFRGQLADWDKLAPTFHRLVPTKANEARQKADNFATWVKQAPGLEDIASNDDKIIAVAQHYGLATTFLDFTTEPAVAGYFAADGGPPPEGMNSCIICINLDEAVTIWDSMKAIARTPRSS